MRGPEPVESVLSIVLSTAVATSSVFVAAHGYPIWISWALLAAAVASFCWALSAWHRQQRRLRGGR